MNTTTNQELGNAVAFQSISVGDEIVIECAGMKSRRVIVEASKVIGGRMYFFTSGGKVRPSHIAGGSLWDRDGVLYFQPTLQQSMRVVTSVAVLRCAAARN